MTRASLTCGSRPHKLARALKERAFARPARALMRAALACVLSALACKGASPAGQRVVTAVDVAGGAAAQDPELRRGIATRPDATYDPSVLAKDLERIQRFYRALGYYDASVRAARVTTAGNDRVH